MTVRGRPNPRPRDAHAQISMPCRQPTKGWTIVRRAISVDSVPRDYLEAAGDELRTALAAGGARYLGTARGLYHVYERAP